MTQPEQQFWQQYWGDHPVTVTAATMTQILDRIKLEYLKALLPRTGRTLEVGLKGGGAGTHPPNRVIPCEGGKK